MIRKRSAAKATHPRGYLARRDCGKALVVSSTVGGLGIRSILVRQRVRRDVVRPQPLAPAQLQLRDLATKRRHDQNARAASTKLDVAKVLRAWRRCGDARAPE